MNEKHVIDAENTESLMTQEMLKELSNGLEEGEENE